MQEGESVKRHYFKKDRLTTFCKNMCVRCGDILQIFTKSFSEYMLLFFCLSKHVLSHILALTTVLSLFNNAAGLICTSLSLSLSLSLTKKRNLLCFFTTIRAQLMLMFLKYFVLQLLCRWCVFTSTLRVDIFDPLFGDSLWQQLVWRSDGKIYRQTNIQTDRQTNRQLDKYVAETKTQTNKQTQRKQRDRQINKQTDIQTRSKNKQTDSKQNYVQIHIQTQKLTYNKKTSRKTSK